jgi:hypothetical protein
MRDGGLAHAPMRGRRRKARDGEGEGPGLTPEPSRRARGQARRVEACAGWPWASSLSDEERRRVDGRFGRCRGCGRVHVFCGPCASVGACCGACSGSLRRGAHRRANRRYSRTEKGRASNRARQARRRGQLALARQRVTDTLSTEERASRTPPAPSSSSVEPTRDTEVSTHGPSNRASGHRPAGEVARCARCGRVLSGRVRPSEWTPPRRSRRRRAPRLPRAPSR